MATSRALQALRAMCAEVEREAEALCDPLLAQRCGLGEARVRPPLSPAEEEQQAQQLRAARDSVKQYIPESPQDYLRRYTPSPIFPAIVRRNMEVKNRCPVCDRCYAQYKSARAREEAEAAQNRRGGRRQAAQAKDKEEPEESTQQNEDRFMRHMEAMDLFESLEKAAQKKAPVASGKQQQQKKKQQQQAAVDTNTLREAAWYCPECATYLCSECDVASHAPGSATEQHNRLTIGQYVQAYDSKTYGFGFCREHPRQPVLAFCQTCQVMVCLICALDAHAKHSLYSVEEETFDVGQLVEPPLTKKNLYACLQPFLRFSSAPIDAYGREQLDKLRADGVQASSQEAAPRPVARDFDKPLVFHGYQLALPCSPLPPDLEGVSLRWAHTFAPLTEASAGPQRVVVSAITTAEPSSLAASLASSAAAALTATAPSVAAPSTGATHTNALEQALQQQRGGWAAKMDIGDDVAAMASRISALVSAEAEVPPPPPPPPMVSPADAQQRAAASPQQAQSQTPPQTTGAAAAEAASGALKDPKGVMQALLGVDAVKAYEDAQALPESALEALMAAATSEPSVEALAAAATIVMKANASKDTQAAKPLPKPKAAAATTAKAGKTRASKSTKKKRR